MKLLSLQLLFLQVVITFPRFSEASNPADDPELKASRTALESWEQDGKTWSIYGYGTLIEKTVPLTPPPGADSETVKLNSGLNTTVWEWTNGTTVEAISYRKSEKLNDKDSHNKHLASRCFAEEATARACKYEESYYWGSGWTGGDWSKPWKRTSSTAYNGAFVSFCDFITILPTYSGSISVGWGPIAGSLGISPEPGSTKGFCWGCVARTNGDKCSRLWYREKMSWRQGNLWRNEKMSDPQNNPCSFCNEYNRNVLVGENIHVDWAQTSGGIAQLEPGCSPCNE